MWRNEIKCKYMFMFPLKNLARKGLIATWSSSYRWVEISVLTHNLCLLMVCKLSIYTLAPGRLEWNFREGIFNVISVIYGWGISWEIVMRWILLDIGWMSLIDIGSGNGLLLSGNKLLPEPVLTQIPCHVTSLCHDKFKHFTGNSFVEMSYSGDPL